MQKYKILKLEGFELLDSRSNPTVGARVTLVDGSKGFAIAPSEWISLLLSRMGIWSSLRRRWIC